MKRQLVLAAVAATLLFAPLTANADSQFKKSRWASQLQKGVLKVQGPGYGGWGKRWVTVDSGVKSYGEVGTSHGPVIVYSKGPKSWHVIQLRFNTGARLNPRNFNAPVTIIRGGRFGALLKVGNQCHDYSWKQLRAIDCKTKLFK